MRSYLALLRIPGVVRLTAWQLFARLPLGMLSLAILLHVQATTGSYGQAGAVVACVSVAEAAAMPLTARLTGIVGVSPIMLPAALLNAGAMLGMALVPPNPFLLCGLGILIGASVPPLMPVMRALYPQLVPPDVVRALFALDTTAQELIWVIGPVTATFLATAVTTAAPLIAASLVTFGGTIGFLTGLKQRTPRIERGQSSFGRVLAQREVILAMIASLALVASFMALEVGVVAEHGHDGVTAGILIAVSSLGSLCGGMLLGHRRLGLGGLTAMLAITAIGPGLVALTDSLLLQNVALFASGFGFAPALATIYTMVSRGVEEHAATETFGWLNTGGLAGGAIGTAIAGIAGDASGPIGAYVVATALALIAVVSPLLVRLSGPIHGLTD
jgi:MFS family permease